MPFLSCDGTVVKYQLKTYEANIVQNVQTSNQYSL